MVGCLAVAAALGAGGGGSLVVAVVRRLTVLLLVAVVCRLTVLAVAGVAPLLEGNQRTICTTPGLYPAGTYRCRPSTCHSFRGNPHTPRNQGTHMCTS